MVAVAIHQPNYLPWLGYFHKIYAADIFILLDTVQHKPIVRRTFIRKTPNMKNVKKADRNKPQKKTLSIPLQSHSKFDIIREISINNDVNWPDSHLNQIEFVYKNSPYFDDIFPTFVTMVNTCPRIPRLALMNHYLIMTICCLLGMECKTEIHLASNIPVERKKSTENLITLIKHFNGTKYLSGTGAKKYQDLGRFGEEGIKVEYQNMFSFLAQHKYPQAQGEFVNGLSIVDALFNIGPVEIMNIFDEYEVLKQ